MILLMILFMITGILMIAGISLFSAEAAHVNTEAARADTEAAHADRDTAHADRDTAHADAEVAHTTAKVARASSEKVLPAKRQGGELKILITADQVEFDPQNERATYTGNVTVKQENTCLNADRIEVHFIAKGKGIELIKAFGNLKVTQEDRTLTAEEGVYYQQDRKVVLTGNPTTRQGANCISGDKIVYFWDQGKAVVEGNVKATVIMDKEKVDMLRPK
jgi:lipopolysaccharide transport protein LptA